MMPMKGNNPNQAIDTMCMKPFPPTNPPNKIPNDHPLARQIKSVFRAQPLLRQWSMKHCKKSFPRDGAQLSLNPRSMAIKPPAPAQDRPVLVGDGGSGF